MIHVLSDDRRLSLLGGALSILSSCLLLVVVLTRDVGLNVLNGWTIVLGLAAGLALLPERLRSVRAHTLSQVLLILAAVPALVGGLGLLYIPSFLLVTIAKHRGGRRHSTL